MLEFGFLSNGESRGSGIYIMNWLGTLASCSQKYFALKYLKRTPHDLRDENMYDDCKSLIVHCSRPALSSSGKI